MDRYLLVTADFNQDAIPKPVLEKMPEEKPAEKAPEKTAAPKADAKTGKAAEGQKGGKGKEAPQTAENNKAGAKRPAKKTEPAKEALALRPWPPAGQMSKRKTSDGRRNMTARLPTARSTPGTSSHDSRTGTT